MMHRNVHRAFLCLVLVSAFTGSLVLAQNHPGSRITGPIDERGRVTLKGNVHPLAQLRYDQGAVLDSFPVQRMFLVLRRPPEREDALRQFLEEAHTLGGTSYHKWLKPEQFGELYGPDDSEMTTVIAWLQRHGFSVACVTKGKTAVEFSGTAGQLREAFGTEIHTYLVDGEEHHANDRDPQIPDALAPVIAGITPMNDFPAKSYTKVLGQASFQAETHAITPQWTLNTQPLLALGPSDFAVQYDLNPLYTAGVNGNGVTIGIISLSNVDPTIVAAYRTLFGLPAGPLNVIIDGSDPGQNGAVVEAHLDVEIAGSVAPGAAINLYAATGTTVQNGLVLAAQRAVDDDQATILSTSYGICEQSLGSAGNQFWANVWEQAAAQGQTSFVSGGDGGPAGCDNFNQPQAAQHGLAVSGFSSTPWNIAVGGTDFFYTSYNGNAASQNSELATYWNLTPAKLPSTSLLKPIPEQPWNRPFGLNLSTTGVYDPPPATIVAGSGGASSCASGTGAPHGSFASCTAGYPKPSWQTGEGVPADGVRDLPDISLFAAAGENNSAYPICAFPNECTQVNGGTALLLAGGTSASSPAMAGIMALVNQKFGAQGQANFVLYPLAAQHPTVFHDVTVDSNNVPCQQNSPSCNPPSINVAGTGVITATVPGVSGQPTPTGSVGIFASEPGNTCSCGGATLVNGSANITLDGSLFNIGTISVRVGYSGDSIYAPDTVTLFVPDAFPFTMSATPVVITAPGASTGNTSPVTITPVNGFTGTVYLSCALTTSPPGAVNPPTCSIPASANIPDAAPVTALMTINSTAPRSCGLVEPIPHGPLPTFPPWRGSGWRVDCAGAVLICLLLF